MNYKSILDFAAIQLQAIIESADGIKIETEDFGWSNTRFVGDTFRMAHIERYSDKNLEVLHFTCFPLPTLPNSIFGFDIITTDKRPLAAFADWSQVCESSPMYIFTDSFEKPYPLPDWAKSIFSSSALAIIPNDNEMDKLISAVIKSFDSYIDLLYNSEHKPNQLESIVAAQNRYCDNQQKNQRTFNVLKAKLGEERAKYFMTEILFPKIKS
jgi:phycocyanobilin:ferredoxin oxidoreductase